MAIQGEMWIFVVNSAEVYAPRQNMPAVPRFICPVRPVIKFNPVTTIMLINTCTIRFV